MEPGECGLWQAAWKKWPCSEGQLRRIINSTASLPFQLARLSPRVHGLSWRGPDTTRGQGVGRRGRGQVTQKFSCCLETDTENCHQTTGLRVGHI